jgi:hypothetical protein
MRPADIARAETLTGGLLAFAQDRRPIPGVATEARRASLVRQMIDSLHRVDYVRRLGERPIAPQRADPRSELFDPLKAALLQLRAGNPDEAAWLVFLSTHFGFHQRTRWRSTRMVYGALGGAPWTWARTSANPKAFRVWFELNADALASIRFGNHRKYVSIRVDVRENLADAVESYISWVGGNRGHMLLFAETSKTHGGDPRATFEGLYTGMTIRSFGRTGRFDYLTMVAKLGLCDIDPAHPYFGNATGPVEGASLLFTNSKATTLPRSTLSGNVVELGDALGVNMQVMEDSLCNWQKSPEHYLPFRG